MNNIERISKSNSVDIAKNKIHVINEYKETYIEVRQEGFNKIYANKEQLNFRVYQLRNVHEINIKDL